MLDFVYDLPPESPEATDCGEVPQFAQPSRKWRYLPALWVATWLLLACGLFVQSWTRNLATPAVAKASTATPATGKKFASKAIQDIRTGMRVIADNPELNGQDASPSEIVPQTWRNVRFRMKKPDGGELLITLLRPLEWLADRHGEVGRDVELNLEELGVAAPATILAIEPCPEIEKGNGRVVTGIFQHSAANVIDLYVTGQKLPIGTTSNHPFWSETRQAFVHAGSLQPGEELRTATAVSTVVIRIVPRSRPTSVFNLEVDAEHAYCVADNGVVVHNTYLSHLRGRSVQVLRPSLGGTGPNRWHNLITIPANATRRTLHPVPGRSTLGYEYKWVDANGKTWRVRFHNDDPGAPAGSNSASGWTARVLQGKHEMDPSGTLRPDGIYNPASPHHSPFLANEVHIPFQFSSTTVFPP